MALSREQTGVVAGMIGAIIVIAFALVGAVVFWGSQDALVGPDRRLALCGTCVLAPAVALALSIARLARHRFFSAQDINGSAFTDPTETARILQALIQNTLEQTALALAVYLAWSTLAPAYFLPALPAAAILFLAGRLLFFAGYARGAVARSFGFALTFYPTVVLLAGSLFFAVLHARALMHAA